jgi:hypothetical protein
MRWKDAENNYVEAPENAGDKWGRRSKRRAYSLGSLA